MFLGEVAALATSLMFSLTSTQFTLAGRAVGAGTLNRARLFLAVIFLALAHWITGIVLPWDAPLERWFWLAISGLVGLVIGDAFLFQAFIWIGPRLSMLMMSLAPIIAALLAWLFLGEALNLLQVAAIIVTVGGIAWVILDGNSLTGQIHGETSHYFKGLLFGLGGATGQALGLITAKRGLWGDFPALSGTFIRMLSAMLAIWIFAIFQKRAAATLRTLWEKRKAAVLILGGAISGPFLGVTFSLVAIQHTQVGIASTLMALPPVILLPVGHYLFKERIGWQAVAGTVVALSGVAILFLV